MHRIFKIILALQLVLVFSCDRPTCNNTNPIFDEYEYSDDIYKRELAKELQRLGLENVRTWLADYIELDENTYLVFYIQNDTDLCAKAMVQMNHWDDKTAHIKEQKGKGRFNAEFADLQFKISVTEDGKTEFVYESFGRIID